MRSIVGNRSNNGWSGAIEAARLVEPVTRQTSEPVREESRLDLPTTYRIPVTWLTEHGGPDVRYRTMAELAPEGAFDAPRLSEALRVLVLSPEVSAITTRQADDGLWGDNFLAFQPSERDGIEEVGTVAQYRRLVQLGVPSTTRPFRLANRVLFRTLSRDEDPPLLGEVADAAAHERRVPETVRHL